MDLPWSRCNGRAKYPRRNGEPVDLDYQRVVLDVLSPEWDVLIEIQKFLQCLQEVTLEYIQGHQDKKLPYLQLPLTPQLNVVADALASMFNCDDPESRPLVILSPRAHLLLGGNSNIKTC